MPRNGVSWAGMNQVESSRRDAYNDTASSDEHAHVDSRALEDATDWERSAASELKALEEDGPGRVRAAVARGRGTGTGGGVSGSSTHPG